MVLANLMAPATGHNYWQAQWERIMKTYADPNSEQDEKNCQSQMAPYCTNFGRMRSIV